MLPWILIVIGSLWLLVIVANKVIPFVNKLRAGTVPESVASTVDKIDDYADMVAAIGASFTITAIAKKRGNAELASKMAEVRVLIVKDTNA